MKRGIFVFLMVWVLTGCGKNRTYDFDENARDGGYVMAALETMPSAEPSYFTMEINQSPSIRQGALRIPFMASNPEENECDVQVSVYVDGEEEPFYVSPVLKRGEREAYGSVERNFRPGQYGLTAVFTLLEPESGKERGQMEAGLILTVSP